MEIKAEQQGYMPDMLKDVVEIDRQITYDKAYPVVMSNSMIKGRQPMNIREQKIFRLLLSQVQPDTEQFQVFQIALPTLAKILGIKSVDSLRRDINKIVLNLQTQLLAIRYFDENDVNHTNEKWRYINIMSVADFDKSYLRLQLSEKLKPYVLNLQGDYTKYPITTIAGFESGYAMRIYEILLMTYNKCYRKRTKFVVDVQMLKSVLREPNPNAKNDTDKYARYYNFKTRVLNPAVEQINANLLTEFTVAYTEIKHGGKAVVELQFEITPRLYFTEPSAATPEERQALENALAMSKQLATSNTVVLNDITEGTIYITDGKNSTEGVPLVYNNKKKKNVIPEKPTDSIQDFVTNELSTKDDLLDTSVDGTDVEQLTLFN